MKKIFPLLFLLLFCVISCNHKVDKDTEMAENTIVSDHAYLEEAKAIARKLIEGSEKVKKKEISRAEFERKSRNLQKQLNTLIMSLDDKELQELENYRNALLAENAGKKPES